MIATCSGLGGTWTRLSCEPKPAATSDRFGTIYQEARGTPKPNTACLVFVNIRKILGKPVVKSVARSIVKAGCSYGKSTGSSLSGPTSWVDWGLRESPGQGGWN